MMDIDSIALEAARNVMNELLANSYPKGGNVQLQAIIQCMIADVLRQQLAEKTSGEPMCFAKKSDVEAGFRINDVAMLQIRDYTEPLYAKPPSVEVLLEALRELVNTLDGYAHGNSKLAPYRNLINAYSSKPITVEDHIG
jgi:hypothetical protein